VRRIGISLEELGYKSVNEGGLRQGDRLALGIANDADAETKLNLPKVRNRPFGAKLRLEKDVRRRVTRCAQHVIDVYCNEVHSPVLDAVISRKMEH
jgi:hypothetical protein